MIRSPKLCDLIYKTERKRYNEDKLREIHEKSVFTLRQYKFDEKTADSFVEDIYSTVDK